MARAYWLFLGLSLSALLVSTVQAETVTIGPATAEVQFENRSACSLGVGQDICVATIDLAHGTSLGSDSANATYVIQNASLRLRTPPGLPPLNVSMQPSSLIIYHPANHVLNATWIALNDSLPGPAMSFVTLESREINTGQDPEPRGFVVVLQSPYPLSAPILGSDRTTFSESTYSWDCSDYFTSYGNWDKACSYDYVEPLPNGISNYDHTHRMLGVPASILPCAAGYTNIDSSACPAFGDSAMVSDWGAEIADSQTPDIAVGETVQEVTVQTTPYHEPPNAPTHGDGAHSHIGVAGPHSPAGTVRSEKASSPRATPRPSSGDSTKRQTHTIVVPPKGHGSTSPRGGPSGPGWKAAVGAVVVAATLLTAIGFALYHRVRRSTVLENPNRRRAYELIKSEPGKTAGAMAKALGLNYVTTKRHLGILRSHHLIESHREPGAASQQRYFLNGGSYTSSEKDRILALSSGQAKPVFDYIALHRRVEFQRIVKDLRIPYASASRTVASLVEARLVQKDRVGGRLVVAVIQA